MPEPLKHTLPTWLRRSLNIAQAVVPKTKPKPKEEVPESTTEATIPLEDDTASDETISTSKPRFGSRLADALTELGPSYIKLGQLLSTRPDIVGAQMAKDLQHLQDKLPPFSVQVAWDSLAEEFGAETDTLFAHLGFPIAAASVAQVHRATIHMAPSDERAFAAVKILRPQIERKVLKDFETFAWIAEKVEDWSPKSRRLEPVQLVKTLRESTETELDLRMEAAAASELADKDEMRGLIRVPRIEWQHTSRRVLTTEWIDGIPIAQLEKLEAAGHDPKELAQQLLEAFLIHALFDGYFHADLHPGNIMVDEDGRLAVVDFGIMGRLDRETRRFLAEILYGFLSRDYVRLAEVHFEAGYVPTTKSKDSFAQALRSIGEPVFGLEAQDISMARLLEQLFETTRMFDMHLQPQLVLLQKTMVAVEGVARMLNPSINFWEAARPVVQDWMEQNLGPEAVVEDIALSAQKMVRALRHLPDLAKQASTISHIVTPDGLRLHPETVMGLSDQQTKGHAGNSATRFWMMAAIVLALFSLVLHF